MTFIHESPAESPSRTCLGMEVTRKVLLTVSALSAVSISSGVITSLQGPIYPPEAERKGMTATEYGMVFGIFELVAFFVSPIYGKYMEKVGAKALAIFGLTMGGIVYIFFGLLVFVDDYLPFISLSFLLRILSSVCSSASFNACFSITAGVFPQNVGTVYAILECCFGLGFSVGPTIGEALFEAGGFLLPFVMVGVILLLLAVLLYCALPNIRANSSSDKPKAGLLSVLKLPSALLDFSSLILANITMGFNTATLENHLRQFDLGLTATGAIFGISAGFYMALTPVIGRLCDTGMNTKTISLAGCVLVIVGMSLVGPLPFLDLKPTLYLVGPALAVTGSGISCLMIPGVTGALKSAIQGGLPDDMNTYGVVSGISTSSVFLGGFIGPSIAGVLLDKFGYRWSTLLVIAASALQLLVTTTYLVSQGISCYYTKKETLIDAHSIFYSKSIDQISIITCCSDDCPGDSMDISTEEIDLKGGDTPVKRTS